MATENRNQNNVTYKFQLSWFCSSIRKSFLIVKSVQQWKSLPTVLWVLQYWRFLRRGWATTIHGWFNWLSLHILEIGMRWPLWFLPTLQLYGFTRCIYATYSTKLESCSLWILNMLCEFILYSVRVTRYLDRQRRQLERRTNLRWWKGRHTNFLGLLDKNYSGKTSQKCSEAHMNTKVLFPASEILFFNCNISPTNLNFQEHMLVIMQNQQPHVFPISP